MYSAWGWVGGFFSPPCLSSFDSFYICELCIPREEEEEEEGAMASSAQKLGSRRTGWFAPGWDRGKSQEPAQVVPFVTTVVPPGHARSSESSLPVPNQESPQFPGKSPICLEPRGQNLAKFITSHVQTHIYNPCFFIWGCFSRRVCNFSFLFPVLPACARDGLSTLW